MGTKCKVKELGYELLEITSSGLTHTCNRNSLGLCYYVLHAITPKTNMKSDFIVKLNYGVIEF